MSAAGEPSYDLSVVIACYQEEGHLRESVRQLTEVLDATGRSYELLFLEDKSTDRTAEIIAELVADKPHWRAVYHQQNVGRGGTVTEGFRLAQGRIVGFLDIDLEVHARFLPAVLEAIDSGADGATAFRGYEVEPRFTSIVRHVLSQGYRWLFRMLFDVPFKDPETGFKFFLREKIVPVALRTRDVHWFWDSEIMVLAHKAGLRIVEVPCRFERRADKQSTVRILPDVWKYLVAIRAFKKRLRAQRRAASAPAEAQPESEISSEVPSRR
ncbi:MAG: glycosyltransferase family 2 protein [Planctomycetes bacterium]|nr:glycosyltransferase family 2 protein [Planctomycetota bacterium]